MITYLRHKPQRVPSDGAARLTDDFLKILTVKAARQCAGRVSLVGVALALMPQHGPEAVRPELFHASGEHRKGLPIALPCSVGQLLYAAFDGRWIREGASLGQPLAHTRRPNAAGDEANRHVEPLRDR